MVAATGVRRTPVAMTANIGQIQLMPPGMNMAASAGGTQLARSMLSGASAGFSSGARRTPVAMTGQIGKIQLMPRGMNMEPGAGSK